MALVIEDPEAERLAHELAALTGESVEEAIKAALRERLARAADRAERLARINEIVERFRARRIHDDRTDDEILGYDENGLPT